MSALREAAQQALEALDSALGAVDGHYYDAVVPSANIAADALRTALAESDRDWSLLEATQESLREHMAEIQRLRAVMAQPATIAEWWAAKQAASGEQTEFMQALHGGKGDLDAWLECNSEAEVRAHVLALIQPAASGEPVAWIEGPHGSIRMNILWKLDPMPPQSVAWSIPLYTMFPKTTSGTCTAQPAPARVPLTDEQINQITAAQLGRGLGAGAPYAAYRAYARAVEAAHGITAKEAP